MLCLKTRSRPVSKAVNRTVNYQLQTHIQLTHLLPPTRVDISMSRPRSILGARSISISRETDRRPIHIQQPPSTHHLPSTHSPSSRVPQLSSRGLLQYERRQPTIPSDPSPLKTTNRETPAEPRSRRRRFATCWAGSLAGEKGDLPRGELLLVVGGRSLAGMDWVGRGLGARRLRCRLLREWTG